MSKEKVTITIPSCPLDSFNNEHTGKTCSQITSDIKKACGGNMNNLGKTVHDTKCEVAKSAFNQGVKYATEQAKKQNIKTNVIYFTLGCVTVGTITKNARNNRQLTTQPIGRVSNHLTQIPLITSNLKMNQKLLKRYLKIFCIRSVYILHNIIHK